MRLPHLDLDRWFPDFNFHNLVDPTLTPGHGPNRTRLAEWVYRSRQGEVNPGRDFANTMYWTLREETFRCFERAHGARPIRYDDWFYCKLTQFLELLVYERLSLTYGPPPECSCKPATDRPWEEGFLVLGPAEESIAGDVQAAFAPEDNDSKLWAEIVAEVSSALGDRVSVLEGILARRGRAKGTPKVWEWKRKKRRNDLIRELLEQGKDTQTICEVLDQQHTEPLPAMRAAGIDSWVTGWTHARVNRNIQQLVAKQKGRKKPVKR
jgi:hypothetical protein